MGIVEISLTAGLTVLLIVVIRALTQSSLPKVCFVVMWELTFLRLLIPASLPLPILPAQEQSYSGGLVMPQEAKSPPAFYEIPTIADSAPAGVYEVPQIADYAPAVIQNAPLPKSDPQKGGISAEKLVKAVWLVGAVMLAAIFGASYLRTLGKFKGAETVEDDGALETVSDFELKRSVTIKCSGSAGGPLTYGVIRPVIMLPDGWKSLSQNDLRLILSHELTHIRRFDSLRKAFCALALCVHWFNPLVWVMWLLYSRDIEYWCDEGVLKRAGSDKENYAWLLIGMEERKSSGSPLMSRFGRTAAEERIFNIMKFKKTTLIASVTALALVLAITAAVIATAVTPVPKTSPEPMANVSNSAAEDKEVEDKKDTSAVEETEDNSYTSAKSVFEIITEKLPESPEKLPERALSKKGFVGASLSEGEAVELNDYGYAFELKKGEQVVIEYSQAYAQNQPVQYGYIKDGEMSPITNCAACNDVSACSVFVAPEDGDYTFYLYNLSDDELVVKTFSAVCLEAPLHTDVELHCWPHNAVTATDSFYTCHRTYLGQTDSMINIGDVIYDGVNELDHHHFEQGQRAVVVLDFRRSIPERFLSMSAGCIIYSGGFLEDGEVRQGIRARYSLGAPFVYDETCLIFPFVAPETGDYEFHFGKDWEETVFIPGRWVEAENSGEPYVFGKITLDEAAFKNASVIKWTGPLSFDKSDAEILAEMKSARKPSSVPTKADPDSQPDAADTVQDSTTKESPGGNIDYSVYEPYGLLYDSQNRCYTFNGSTVRYFNDPAAGASFTNYFTGTVDIEAEYDAKNVLIGIKECSKEVYDYHDKKQAAFSKAGRTDTTVQSGTQSPETQWFKDYEVYGISYNAENRSWYYGDERIKVLIDSEKKLVYQTDESGIYLSVVRNEDNIAEIKKISEADAKGLMNKNNPQDNGELTTEEL